MSLRDDLVTLFGRDDFTAAEFMDSTSVDGLADAVLALLRERGKMLKPDAYVMSTAGFGWTGIQAQILAPMLLIDLGEA